MNYNIDDITPFVENYDFLEYFTYHEEDWFVSAIKGQDYDWEDGASKLVIIPESLDYVIKIPFNASYDEYGEWDNDYIEFSQNYCETEIELYEKIKEENPLFCQFLLPLTRIDEITEYDIYIQPKCQVYSKITTYDINKTYSKKSMEKVKSNNLNLKTSLPKEWLAAVTEVLDDIKLVEDFIEILKKYDLTQDLHGGNFGYCNGKPVIFDYAGFYD